VRAVVPIRLGAAERDQIARAAARRDLPVSSFIRQAALAASAVVMERVTPVKPRGDAPSDEVPGRGVPVVVLEEPRPWIVDGMRILPDGRVVDWDEHEE
jgi:hypothetical protein